jgi:hypothetical protein
MLSMLLTTVLPALLPAAIDGVKAVVNKVTDNAGALPSNFQEALELERFQLEKLKALAELDRPSGPLSQWVSDLRSSSRYIAVFLILGTWSIITLFNLPLDTKEYELLANMAQSAFFFLFGDRIYMSVRNRRG